MEMQIAYILRNADEQPELVISIDTRSQIWTQVEETCCTIVTSIDSSVTERDHEENNVWYSRYGFPGHKERSSLQDMHQTPVPVSIYEIDEHVQERQTFALYERTLCSVLYPAQTPIISLAISFLGP